MGSCASNSSLLKHATPRVQPAKESSRVLVPKLRASFAIGHPAWLELRIACSDCTTSGYSYDTPITTTFSDAARFMRRWNGLLPANRSSALGKQEESKIAASNMGSLSTTPLLRNPTEVRRCSQHAERMSISETRVRCTGHFSVISRELRALLLG